MKDVIGTSSGTHRYAIRCIVTGNVKGDKVGSDGNDGQLIIFSSSMSKIK